MSNSNAENACLEFYVATRELLLIEGAWATCKESGWSDDLG